MQQDNDLIYVIVLDITSCWALRLNPYFGSAVMSFSVIPHSTTLFSTHEGKRYEEEEKESVKFGGWRM